MPTRLELPEDEVVKKKEFVKETDKIKRATKRNTLSLVAMFVIIILHVLGVI